MTSTPTSATSATPSACQSLIQEVQTYRYGPALQRQRKISGIAQFVEILHKELAVLEKAAENPANAGHVIESSNFGYLRAVWDVARGAKRVAGLMKTFYFKPAWSKEEGSEGTNGRSKTQARKTKGMVMVEVIDNAGLRWIKVSTITARRLRYELADLGWYGHPQSDTEDEESTERRQCGPPYEELQLTSIAQKLIQASAQERIQYLHPEIAFVLPNLAQPASPEEKEIVDGYTNYLRNLGIQAQIGSELLPPPTLETLPNGGSSSLACTGDVDPDPVNVDGTATPLSPTLNLDITTLLALTSDISHYTHPTITHLPSHGQHPAIAHQIACESQSHLLVGSLWPVLEGRGLECTEGAAEKYREVVGLVGNGEEKERASLLLHEGGRTPEWEEKWSKLSEYELPRSIQLPVKIVPFTLEDVPTEELPGFTSRLSKAAREVFVVGWVQRKTSITANKAITKMVRQETEDRHELEGERRPGVWLHEARSLRGDKRED
ncbi:hypothetical protein SAICODRAFT_24135 [Saitoella complicata NRRL Y-17804]|uniref:DUF1308 domain-containing protein n=1 Tax=Saitoella complicata (strain BCRC 22490 / CBS 7301 / JCM 7358 / NBRC 10748 / NRRL Y-17804) TaxID=698492 RepID=A0A0E9N7U1_SAICN|nr:uncharacterized protein SAICODRAFT_24135 [Saitoella complicata NRRL Y-17804]ODQ54332.1 hypothetical protein SAICODRAFT_24135 [Saitoella complicata NRRL Y-17804]GAO45791.1 hypothetical protein G7K_0042-t1 [Saitoella complicata NRRL Y-17804]